MIIIKCHLLNYIAPVIWTRLYLKVTEKVHFLSLHRSYHTATLDSHLSSKIYGNYFVVSVAH